jgi:hypothetical protein
MRELYSKKSIKLYWSEICQNCRGKKIREIHLGQSQLQRPRVYQSSICVQLLLSHLVLRYHTGYNSENNLFIESAAISHRVQ